jgi:hypothetical protein
VGFNEMGEPLDLYGDQGGEEDDEDEDDGNEDDESELQDEEAPS